MVPIPKAVRVRTSNGWQDMALQGPQGRPGGAMVKLREITVSTAQPTIDFDNIPQLFDQLVLIGHVNCTGGANAEIGCRINNDSSASYDHNGFSALFGAAPANSGSASGTTRWRLGVCGQASELVAFTTTIPDYASTTRRKHFHSICGGYIVGGMYTEVIGGRYYATPAAITRLLLFITSGVNFEVGSRVALYGIGTQDATQYTDVYCQLPQNNTAQQTSCANGLWTQVIIPTTPTLVISKSDGINDDFTRNTDGSVTINKAGNYHFEAVAAEMAATWPDAASINFGLAKKNNAVPTTNDWLTVAQFTSGSVTNNYPTCPVSCDIMCAVGDRVNAWLWHNSGAARNIALRIFSITRMGSGPSGPQGPPYAQITQPYSITAGYTADRALNPESSSLTEVARVLGTLISDMKASGLIIP